MTPGEFIAKWRASELKERSAAQEHFIDLCRLLDEPTPAEADPAGDHYCFECRDAILTPEGGEPDWPAADVVIGNPPFLGGKLLNTYLGEDYVSRIFEVYAGRVPVEADLVCYWFVKAGEQVEAARSKRGRAALAIHGVASPLTSLGVAPFPGERNV